MRRLLAIFACFLGLAAGAANVRLGVIGPDDWTVIAYRFYAGTNRPATWSNAVVRLEAPATNSLTADLPRLSGSVLWTNVPSGVTWWLFVTASNIFGCESDPSNTLELRIPAAPMLQPPSMVRVLALIEQSECIEGPWTMLASLGEHHITTEPTAQFFRLRGSIEKTP